MTSYDSNILFLIIGLVTGMYGPSLMAWVLTMGDPPARGRKASLRELLQEEPARPDPSGRIPRPRGRHAYDRAG